MKKIFFLALLVLVGGAVYSQVPGPPTLISPPNGGILCPPYILDWSDVPTATSYRIQISINSNFTQIIVDENTTNSQYTFSVSQGSSFYWKACAINSSGQGPWSNPWQVIGGSFPVLTNPPNGAVNVPINPTFDWNAVPGATAYILQISKTPLFDTLVVCDTVPPYGTIILQYGTQYYWRVCGIIGTSVSCWSSSSNFTTVVTAPPDPPTLLAPPDGSIVPITNVTFDWSDVPGATSYRIQISTSSNFGTTFANQQTTASQYIHYTPNFASNTLYYWRVNASNSSGTGQWSSVRRFITVQASLPPPSVIYPCGQVNVPLTPTLDWTDVTGATSYRVVITGILDTIVATSEYPVPPGKLNYYTMYYWRVTAINNGGQGSYSPVCNFRTINSIGIKLISSEIPEEYKLYNNYPNPFNPVTNIKYQITNNKFTTLKIFDLLGKEILTLVNEKQTPGTYEVNWNASKYPSGIYFYKIRSGDFTDTKKMILLK